MLHRLFKTSLD